MTVPKQMNFRKISKGGEEGVIFNPKIYVLDFGSSKQGLLRMKLKKIAKSFSENKGWGGGQRPFGTFPKIHPFWWRHPSLSTILIISLH